MGVVLGGSEGRMRRVVLFSAWSVPFSDGPALSVWRHWILDRDADHTS